MIVACSILNYHQSFLLQWIQSHNRMAVVLGHCLHSRTVHSPSSSALDHDRMQDSCRRDLSCVFVVKLVFWGSFGRRLAGLLGISVLIVMATLYLGITDMFAWSPGCLG